MDNVDDIDRLLLVVLDSVIELDHVPVTLNELDSEWDHDDVTLELFETVCLKIVGESLCDRDNDFDDDSDT